MDLTPFRIGKPNTHLDANARKGPAALSQHEKLVKQTQKWVALTFFEPMLKQMRQSPFHSDLMEGGEGGQAFESMFDERLSERMTSSASNTLVNSIVRRIEAKQAYTKHQDSFKAHRRSGPSLEDEGAKRGRAAMARMKTHLGGATHVAPGF